MLQVLLKYFSKLVWKEGIFTLACGLVGSGTIKPPWWGVLEPLGTDVGSLEPPGLGAGLDVAPEEDATAAPDTGSGAVA
jgi:hypothetical protein